MKFLRPLALAAAILAPASPASPQKPAPAQPSTAQLEERIKKLEADLADQKQKLAVTEQKAAAQLQNDYVKNVQSQSQTYYDKVLTTQTTELTIIGLIITVVLWVAGKFSLSIFDSRTKATLDAAVATLEKNVAGKMQTELATLRKENADQLNALEDGLKQQTKTEVTKLGIRSAFGLSVSIAASFYMSRKLAHARELFRATVQAFAGNRDVMSPDDGHAALMGLFITMQEASPQHFADEAKKELSDDLYKKLEPELASVAIHIPELAPLLRERQKATPQG